MKLLLQYLLAGACCYYGFASSPTCDFFVSYARGRDGGAGTLAEPFKTIPHAAYKATSGARTICLRSDGAHPLSKPLYVNSKMSSDTRPMTIRGYAPDIAAGLGRPIISGAIRVGPFSPDQSVAPNSDGRQVWSATAPQGVVRPKLLWTEDGEWLQRARHPNKQPADAMSRHMGVASTLRYTAPITPETNGKWPAVDRTGFRIDPNDFAAWVPKGGLHRAEEVQILHFHAWTAFWSNLSSLDLTQGVLRFSKPTSTPIGQWAKQGGQRFLMENVFEALDEPGEWYWDEGEDKVYFIPPSSLAQQQTPLFVLAPRIHTVLQIDENASFFALEDVEVRYAGAGAIVDTYHTQSAAVRVQQASNISITRVRIASSGGVGILGVKSVQGLTVLDSAVDGVGGDGIAFSQSTGVRDVFVNNSFINDTARVILGQPGGIRLKGEERIAATHNTVQHTPYAGIMVGWQPGLTRHASQARMAANDPIFTVEHNLVQHYGLGILSDFGGIYFSAGSQCIFSHPSPTCWLPTLVRNNVVRNCSRFNYGCEGIYMDEQVSGITMESNLLWGAQDAGVYFHCGADNHFENNIVAAVGWGKTDVDTKLLPAMCNPGGNPTWPDMHGVVGFSFQRNVVMLDDSAVAATKEYGLADVRNATFNSNVYWSSNPETVERLQQAPVWPNASLAAIIGHKHAHVNWKAWRQSGYDADSAIVDPLFADWINQNFTLHPGSPAVTRGFVPFSVSESGCSGNPFSEL